MDTIKNSNGMIKAGITGGFGFIGSHLRFYLYEHKDECEPVLINREDFSDHKKFLEKLGSCDVIVHLAGMNRGDEEEIYNTNVSLTEKILIGLDEISKKPRIIFLSSTHNTRDTAYGRSKRDSELMILKWGEKNKADTISIVSPGIFGEFGKPYYNSAVATFCYELAEKKNSVINESAEVELVYVQDVCSLIFDLGVKKSSDRKHTVSGQKIKIGDIYKILKHFRDEYFSGIIPSYKDSFELHLFNTFRSFLYPRHFPVDLILKTDNRGSFIEVTKERGGGQSSFSTTHTGVVRGNHYHTRKIERFCVLKGEASIKLRKLFSDDIIEYKVSGEKPVFVDMPTYYTHSIENIGRGELLTMFWISEIFDPSNPDTFIELVVI